MFDSNKKLSLDKFLRVIVETSGNPKNLSINSLLTATSPFFVTLTILKLVFKIDILSLYEVKFS